MSSLIKFSVDTFGLTSRISLDKEKRAILLLGFDGTELMKRYNVIKVSTMYFMMESKSSCGKGSYLAGKDDNYKFQHYGINSISESRLGAS